MQGTSYKNQNDKFKETSSENREDGGKYYKKWLRVVL
jgi:hypothetical protein